MNKKNKMFIKFLFLVLVCFIHTNKVNSLYNGSAGTAYSGGGSSGTCGTLTNCGWDNYNKVMIQARLYYIDNGAFSQIGETYYFVNQNGYNMLKNAGLNLIYISSFDAYSTSGDKYVNANKILKKYFGDVEGNPQTTEGISFLNKVTNSSDYKTKLTNESQFANKTTAATKGYRIIIEPAQNYINPTFGNEGDTRALITVKGMASEAKRIHTGLGTNGAGTYSYKGIDMPSCTGRPGGKTTACNNPLLGINSAAQYLYTDFEDVGISATSKSYCESINTDQLADMKNGCGYNIVDISQYVDTPTCYESGIVGDDLVCKNTNQSNVGTYYIDYDEMDDCSNATEEEETNTEDGKEMGTSGTCKIYCKESAVVSFPGNILELQRQGAYFAWPTRPDDVFGKYSMSMKSILDCTIKDEGAASSVAAVTTRKCTGNYKEYNIDQCRSTTETKTKLCYSGYSLRGNSCTSDNFHCPSGYELTNGICKKTTYYCDSGWYLNGTTCSKYGCEDGYESFTGTGINMLCRKQVTDYTCPTGWTKFRTSSSWECKRDVPVYYCPNGYNHYTGSGASMVCRKQVTNYTCPTGWTKYGTSSGWECKTNVTEYYCPSGYSYYSGSGASMTCYKTITSYTCDSGWTLEGTSSGYQCKKGRYYCPYGGSVSGSLCIKQKGYGSSCTGGWTANGATSCKRSAGWTYDYKTATATTSNSIIGPSSKIVTKTSAATASTGYETIGPSVRYDTETKAADSNKSYDVKKSVVTRSKGANAKVTTDTPFRITGSFYCPDGYGAVGNECYKLADKEISVYQCPEGYTLNGTTCEKICNRTALIDSVEQTLEDSSMSAKITGGTNRSINEESLVADKSKGDDVTKTVTNGDKVKITRLVKFRLNKNVNRYYNKITGTVSDSVLDSENIFDRQEGVISLNKNETIYENNNLKRYPLIISKVKIGVNYQFGSKIKNYTCYYSVTDRDDECVCPDGTVNQGIPIETLINDVCENKKDISVYACVDWQKDLCDYDTTSNSNVEVCETPHGYYCTDTSTDAKKQIDITSCVQDKVLNKNKTVSTAIIECRLSTPECTNDWCINTKTNKRVSIKDCLERGESRFACEEAAGCRDSICDPNRCCTGTCNWNYKTKGKVEYAILRCDNNASDNEACNFDISCKDISKETSSKGMECIYDKLNVGNVLDYINSDPAAINKLENIIAECEPKICGGKEKIVYRTIDLANPFPGKSASSNSGLSLTGNKSREPGTNWNSTKIVNKEILKARGVNGYELYTKKEPLLTITLTPNDIKSIRDYNKSNSYNDFKLKCSGKDTSGCISEFLRKSGYVKLNGISNCINLNEQSTIEEFDKCYNSNN